jgi:hypothetical protein
MIAGDSILVGGADHRFPKQGVPSRRAQWAVVGGARAISGGPERDGSSPGRTGTHACAPTLELREPASQPPTCCPAASRCLNVPRLSKGMHGRARRAVSSSFCCFSCRRYARDRRSSGIWRGVSLRADRPAGAEARIRQEFARRTSSTAGSVVPDRGSRSIRFPSRPISSRSTLREPRPPSLRKRPWASDPPQTSPSFPAGRRAPEAALTGVPIAGAGGPVRIPHPNSGMASQARATTRGGPRDRCRCPRCMAGPTPPHTAL